MADEPIQPLSHDSKARQKERSRKWYLANKEAMARKNRARYEANKEECLAKMRAYYVANKEKWAAYDDKKRSRDPEAYMERERLRNRRRYAENKEAYNAVQKKSRIKRADKIRAKHAAYYEENREKIRQASAVYRARKPGRAAEWAMKNPEKAKAADQLKRGRRLGAEGYFTADDIARIYKAQRGLCAMCPTSLKKSRATDHIIPISKGGTNWPRNLQLLCQPCNQRKHAKDPIKFAQEMGRLL